MSNLQTAPVSNSASLCNTFSKCVTGSYAVSLSTPEQRQNLARDLRALIRPPKLSADPVKPLGPFSVMTFEEYQHWIHLNYTIIKNGPLPIWLVPKAWA